MLVIAIAAIAPALVLAPVWRLSGLGAGEDDVLYYLPSRTIFAGSIAAGQAPWLSPWTGLGRPFLADPQSAVFYPTTWLFAAMPAQFAYAGSLWLHYTIALLGAYRLLRSQALDRRAALFGGLAFAFCGFLLAHRAHFSIQHAAAWAPWVFWRIRRMTVAPSGPRWLWCALVAAMQIFAGHVQIAAITALGSAAFLLAEFGLRGRALRAWGATWAAGAALCAVQLAPTFAYLRECTRATREYWMFVENSWNPLSLIGLALPMFFGQRTPNFFDQRYWGPSHQCEQFAYSGWIVLILALATARTAWRTDRTRRAWVVVLALGALTALGQFGPVCPLLYWLPGASVFRVPARAMLLVNLALAALAARTLHDLGGTATRVRAPRTHNQTDEAGAPPRRKRRRSRRTPQRARLRAALIAMTARPWLWMIVALGLLVPFVAAAPALGMPALWQALRPWNPAIWTALVALVLSVLVVGLMARQWKRPALLWLAHLVIVADLSVIGWTIDVPSGARDADELLARTPDWVQRVRASGQRIWIVANTTDVYADPLGILAANANVLAGVQTLNDYGPLQPVCLDEIFAFKPWGVTERAANLLEDSLWMQWFDVGWVLVCDPSLPPPAGCVLVEEMPAGQRLFQNPATLGRAFVEPSETPASVRVIEHSPHSFDVMVDVATPASRGDDAGAANGPPRLVVSRAALAGWRATAGGRGLPIQAAHNALLSIELPAQRAISVEFRYEPPGLWPGALVSIGAGLLLMAAAAGWRAPGKH
ncbi:MAG: hypothetical protein U1D55_14560 [Phycisphaerae bacterium]